MPDPNPFQPCFSVGPCVVSAYLILLNINDTAQGALAVGQVQEALRRPGWAPALRALLEREINWRPHLVAAAALLLLEDPLPFRDALIQAICRGSWVVPQLLVTAWAIDPSFWAFAAQRHAEGFTARIDPDLPARYRPTNPRGNPKELTALLGLAALDPLGAPWAARALADPVCVALRAEDWDRGDEIVHSWRQRMADALRLAGAPHRKLESV
ncbi:MAG: hypothetical protein H6741_32505 [Alphaproteobacteria bacterium]|nr:hypothetical protein [Alphaproteobacteria bacterium]MCB9797437.1 hypothetical protein [Alphaproteobacteria bacterium]